ncbi:F-box only protein 7 [Embiotoca jacksoni]|uniref:F-box only protein 7 n=1 Tax=Embiotoca jacksoni TaxID=100190 RepID=UPI003704C9C3
MKLRVRIHRQTRKVELSGAEPSLKELSDHVKDTLLSAHGLSGDTNFSLFLNGSTPLTDRGQSLASDGIVSGDLICVVMPTPAAAAAEDSTGNATTDGSTDREQRRQTTGQMNSDGGGAVTTAGLPPARSEEAREPEASPPVREPMLCSEAAAGEAPLSLELLYHAAHICSPDDGVMVAGHLLMLETGFSPQGGELKGGEMPAGWRSVGGVYKLQYTHPLCDDSVASVVGVSMGRLLVINTTLKVAETVTAVRNLRLKASSYVTNEWPGESAAAAFKDLRKLSRVFKDQLAYPLIAVARDAMALPVAFGLPALPPELLLRIVRLLDVQSVLQLSFVSRHFNAATADSSLWRHLFRRDFRFTECRRSRDTDWKEVYKTAYRTRITVRRAPHEVFPPYRRRDFPFPPFRPFPALPDDPPIFPALPHVHPVPGIIGGEYDHRPGLHHVPPVPPFRPFPALPSVHPVPGLPHDLLPRPRHDIIGPPPDPDRRPRLDFRRDRPMGGRPANTRRGFI